MNKIKDIALKIGSGVTPSRKDERYWTAPKYPWVKSDQIGTFCIFETEEHISETAYQETGITLWEPRTISIAMYGEGLTRGRCSILMNTMATNQACCNISVNPDCADYRYVYYWLKAHYEQLRGKSVGVRKNLNADEIRDFPITVPKITVQHSIADFLFSLDRKIDLNNAINTELEKAAKLLYDYWFVQFDFPNAEGKPYRASGGEMVYNEQLKREVPKGWTVSKLSGVVDNITEGTRPGEHLQDLPYSPLDAIPMRKMSFVGGRSYEDANSSLLLYKENDILLGAMRVHFHRVCISAQDGITRSTTIIMRPKKPAIMPYLYQVVNSEEAIAYAVKQSGKSQQPYVNWESELENYSFPIPPERLALIYSNKLSPMIERVKSNERENYELTALRDFLLPLLMNGQVRVCG